MAYVRRIWKNREVERPRTYEEIRNSDGTVTLIPAEGNVIEEGTPIIAETMNNIEEGIEEALNKADQAFQSASEGKQKIATAITGKGVQADGGETFEQLASKIGSIETDQTGDATAVAGDIIFGRTAYARGSKLVGSLELIGDAAAGDVIKGKTFYNQNPKTIVTGTLDLTGSASAAQVLSGRTFYNLNPKSKLTGTMTNRGAVTKTITTQGGSYTIPAGYHSGSGKVKASLTNLVASNIRSGVSVGGVTGTFKGGWNFSRLGHSDYDRYFEYIGTPSDGEEGVLHMNVDVAGIKSSSTVHAVMIDYGRAEDEDAADRAVVRGPLYWVNEAYSPSAFTARGIEAGLFEYAIDAVSASAGYITVYFYWKYRRSGYWRMAVYGDIDRNPIYVIWS